MKKLSNKQKASIQMAMFAKIDYKSGKASLSHYLYWLEYAHNRCFKSEFVISCRIEIFWFRW